MIVKKTALDRADPGSGAGSKLCFVLLQTRLGEVVP